MGLDINAVQFLIAARKKGVELGDVLNRNFSALCRGLKSDPIRLSRLNWNFEALGRAGYKYYLIASHLSLVRTIQSGIVSRPEREPLWNHIQCALPCGCVCS